MLEETGSSNADLLAEARRGAREGLVIVADAQTAGRGRMGRAWVSTPGAALTFSVLLRPRGVPAPALSWLPLLAGVATAAAVRAVAGIEARLKWPNDVLAGRGKLAGILAEAWGDAVVVGIGINVAQRRAELPGPAATSLLLEATAGGAGGAGRAAPGRDELLAAVLAELARWYAAWRDQEQPGDADACGLRAEYLRLCATVGRTVAVSLPDGRVITGTAVGVDAAGRLELVAADGAVALSAGDVVHVR